MIKQVHTDFHFTSLVNQSQNFSDKQICLSLVSKSVDTELVLTFCKNSLEMEKVSNVFLNTIWYVNLENCHMA